MLPIAETVPEMVPALAVAGPEVIDDVEGIANHLSFAVEPNAGSTTLHVEPTSTNSEVGVSVRGTESGRPAPR